MFRGRKNSTKTRFYRGTDNMWHFEKTSYRTVPTNDNSNQLIARVRKVQLGDTDQTMYKRSLIKVVNQ